MKLGIMQPYFFPYIGYFELIEKTNKWVVFDVVQFNNKTWMTRNRILHPTKGWQYINIPVEKAHKGTLIRDIKVKSVDEAKNKILGQLEHYKKNAPFYKNVINLVDEGMSRAKSDMLVDLNVSTLSTTCDYLGIDFDYRVCSEMNLSLDNVEHAGQWALRISEQLGAEQYINPYGGKEIFKQDEWANAGIKLSFTEPLEFKYSTRGYEYIPGLSILDVLMWNDPSEIMQFIKSL